MATRSRTKSGIPDWARQKKQAAIYGMLARAMGAGGYSPYGGSPNGVGPASISPVDRAFSAADVAPQSHNDTGTARMYLEIMAQQRAAAEAARKAPINDGRETRDRGPTYLEGIAIEKARENLPPVMSPAQFYSEMQRISGNLPKPSLSGADVFQPAAPGAGTTLADDDRELRMQQAQQARPDPFTMPPLMLQGQVENVTGSGPLSVAGNAGRLPLTPDARISGAFGAIPDDPLGTPPDITARLLGRPTQLAGTSAGWTQQPASGTATAAPMPPQTTQIAGAGGTPYPMPTPPQPQQAAPPFSLPPLVLSGTAQGYSSPGPQMASADAGQIPLNQSGMAASGVPMPVPTPPQPAASGQPNIDPAQIAMRINGAFPQAPPSPSLYGSLPLSGLKPQQITGLQGTISPASFSNIQADASSPFTFKDQMSDDDRLYAAGTNPQVPDSIAAAAQSPIVPPSVPQAAPVPPDMQMARVPRPRPVMPQDTMMTARLPRARPNIDVASLASPLMSLIPTPAPVTAPMPTKTGSQPKSNYVQNRDANTGRYTSGGSYNNSRSYLDPSSRSYRLTNATGNAPTGSR